MHITHSPPNALLADHIADMWVALSASNPLAPDYRHQVESLELFFLSRSYRKFVVRFKEDIRLCGGKRLYDVIRDWRPDRAGIVPKWVSPPGWLLGFQGLPSIKSRQVKEQIQWEFSDDTKHAWSKVLEIILRKVDDGIKQVKSTKGKAGEKTEEETRQAMNALNIWSRTLYYFIVWDAGVVKSLLTETNMVASITTTFSPTGGVICVYFIRVSSGLQLIITCSLDI